ncbi:MULTISPECIES: alanine racemase [Bacillus]|uniref:Alanine racemase n=1 Tax=Bacillus licheniformis (strain ATCC 14580 / DSM 13 / JCM 2505 / CCUG 7422 / NBRC 12200 / NCIMB 9375 / NCTC 10341 / NRRL NRS-1264 / Gibson 46) TaxID=279010 RepID=Q62YK6_BACLD|nr:MULTISPECIES: alanine racemase [Bacillus]AAU22152.2 D-alanine racemase [Bacillus licheniformis DSM 13 = ATCC 14580]MBG9697173.1 alanine racemase [Bacillus licheniformis]MCR3919141.1 alanine racemase [Bacillus licheniformis]MDH3164828.1 alanine racemase [Bacillus licheniformis]NYV83051.1 alanine racemase [Bacillus sp. Gen2]
MSLKPFYRKTWAEIDLTALKENVRNMKRHIGEHVRLMAVVKANAYGHGDAQVAKAALAEGASILAVALLDEALSLRAQGIEEPILVLGAVPTEYASIAAEKRIIVTGYSVGWLKDVLGFLNEAEAPLEYHLKIDTGMGRLGCKTEEEIKEMMEMTESNDKLNCTGVFTHFATADEKDTDYFNMQLDRFKELISPLPLDRLMVHSSNSAAGLRFREQLFNAVRFGIGMYGLAPSTEIKDELPFRLREVFSLHTELTHVKKIKKGESVSYGATYTAQRDEWIGTVPVGYADGWLRRLAGTEVLIDGKRQKIAGRICMDQFMISLAEEYPVGTKVTLIGKQKDEWISVDEIAQNLQTINYEITCMISSRVPRMFLENGSIMEIRNPILPDQS